MTIKMSFVTAQLLEKYNIKLPKPNNCSHCGSPLNITISYVVEGEWYGNDGYLNGDLRFLADYKCPNYGFFYRRHDRYCSNTVHWHEPSRGYISKHKFGSAEWAIPQIDYAPDV